MTLFVVMFQVTRVSCYLVEVSTFESCCVFKFKNNYSILQKNDIGPSAAFSRKQVFEDRVEGSPIGSACKYKRSATLYDRNAAIPSDALRQSRIRNESLQCRPDCSWISGIEDLVVSHPPTQ